MTNLKPFNLEKFLAGEPARCRDPKIKIIDFKYWKFGAGINLEVQIEKDDGHMTYISYDDKGECAQKVDEFDLFMAPVKKTLWIAVFKNPYTFHNSHMTSDAYISEEELRASLNNFDNYENDFNILQIEIETHWHAEGKGRRFGSTFKK